MVLFFRQRFCTSVAASAPSGHGHRHVVLPFNKTLETSPRHELVGEVSLASAAAFPAQFCFEPSTSGLVP